MSSSWSPAVTQFHKRLADALAKASSQERDRVLTTAEIRAIYERCHGKLNAADKENMKASDHCDRTTPRAEKGTGRCSICENGAFLLVRVGERGKYRIAPEVSAPSLALAEQQADELARAAIHPDEVSGAQAPAEELSAAEGRELLRLHRRRERKPQLVRRKKQSVLTECGRLVCEVCGFDFAEFYGSLGEGFAECHHDQPLSVGGERITQLSELSVVCANCHRMLHRRPWRTVAKLREVVLSRRAGGESGTAPEVPPVSDD